MVALRPDYLIVDFFADVHFGVLRLPDGNHVTDNRWKVHHTDWYASALAQGGLDRLTIFDDPDGYLALWEEHYRAFDAFMRRELPETILVVHRGVNVDRLRLPDRRRPVPLQEHVTLRQLDVSLVNRLWRRLDDRAIAISAPEVIDLTAVPWSTWSDHPWGPFYVHYELPYYHRFLAELHRIRLRRGRGGALGPADLAALVDAVDEARREEGALLVDEQRQRAARLRRKLAKRDDGTPE